MEGSQKAGKRSTAQKLASARHDFATMPAANQVPGAFGERRKPTTPSGPPAPMSPAERTAKKRPAKRRKG